MEPPLRQAALFRIPSRGNVAGFRVGILCGSGSCDFVVRRRAAPGDIWTGLLSVRLYPGGGSSSVIARGVGGEIEFGFEEPACGFVQFLGGDGIAPNAFHDELVTMTVTYDEAAYQKEIGRSKMPHLPVAKRDKNFNEVVLGYDNRPAVEEAKRCLHCYVRTSE